jgi:gamma-glutamylcyclotransferase (GGCT)/AIG2-like uncharacterized protein YtfP
MTTTPIFVYGTLKKGFGLSHLLQFSSFVGNAELKGFKLLDFGVFPGAVRDEKAGTLKGEVYEVDEVTLKRLDFVESGYARQLHVTTKGSWVNIYVWKGSKDFDVIPDGIWRGKYRGKRV